MNCPNCQNEFVEKRDKAFRCDNCGWLTEVDGKWVTCPEPAKPVEPPKNNNNTKSVKPADPPVTDPPDKKGSENQADFNRGRHVKSYLGGLITVTRIEDNV